MKITPLAVWCQNLTPREVALAITEDVTIMHSNPFMSKLITAYALSIKYLINNPHEAGRGRKAFEVAVEVSKEDGVDPMLKEWLEKAEALVDFTGEQGFIDLNSYNPQPQMGFVKHAIILSYYCLLRVENDFTDKLDEAYDFAMRQTSMLAGDTDTNCAIVGGLVGAYLGIGHIPDDKVKKVLECDVSLGKPSRRPEFCKVKNGGFDSIIKLLSILPDDLIVESELIQ